MKRYFFMGDLLGFSNIIKNSNADEMEKRISKWIELVKSAKEFAKIDNIQLISDTLFASAGETKDDLNKLIFFSQYLLNNGIKQSLPIRGAICFDEYVWGNLTYGKAVIRAHELESKQNWIGIVCDYIPDTDFYGELLICYSPPIRGTVVKLYPVVNWDVPNTLDLFEFMCREGLTRPDELLNWDLLEKLNNTIQFSLYKHFLYKNNLRASEFVGLTPIQSTEIIVKNMEFTF